MSLVGRVIRASLMQRRLRPPTPGPLVVRLDDDTYGVAVWVRDQAGTPVYEVHHPGIRVLKLAATLAAQETISKQTRQ